MPPFNPSANEALSLFGERYIIQPHPRVPRMAYGQEGSRGTVYKVVRGSSGEAFALKVMKRRARGSDQVPITERLSRYERIVGLRAAYRRVVDSADTPAPANLVGSLLMPWIEGRTWFDVLQRAKEHGEALRPEQALCLCRRFLSILTELEQRGAAHTDIASGNLVVDLDASTVELIDLEDFFDDSYQSPRPDLDVRTPGYSRRYDPGAFWAPHGDRFAAAIIGAEILILAHPEFARLSNGDSFFDPDALSIDMHTGKYGRAFDALARAYPSFHALVARAWSAPRLQDCPSIASLLASLPPDDFPPLRTASAARSTRLHATLPAFRPPTTTPLRDWKSFALPSTKPLSLPPAALPTAAVPSEAPPSSATKTPSAKPVLLAVLCVLAGLTFVWFGITTDGCTHFEVDSSEAP